MSIKKVNKFPWKALLLTFAFFANFTGVVAQDTGVAYGQLLDASTNGALPFATVNLKSTTLGETTDYYGKYYLQNLPVGEQTLVFSFVGYKKVERTVTITAGVKTELNVLMEPDYETLQEVVVTSQALGQAAAINQQINANTIVNVVSQDKIRELPDQNAAEAVGRLPGIAIQRDAGEGQKVVVRGLSPRFNSITVNGERIPSTDNDRSVDLSMMSPDVLAGIEVFKSLTPDKDADAVGGTINFLTKRASNEPEAQLSFQYGYNGQQDEWGQIRGNASVSKRFFNNNLGVLVSGNYQKANRNVDQIDFGYNQGQELGGAIEILPDGVTMRQNLEDRYRYGGSVVLDYLFKPGNRITLNSLIQFTERNRDRFRTSYNGGTGNVDYRQQFSESLTSLHSNTLSGEHKLPNSWNLSWRTSASSTVGDTPINHEMRFIDRGGVESSAANITFPGIVASADTLHSLDKTLLQRVTNVPEEVRATNVTAQIDLEKPIKISNNINGSIKFGGKFRQDDRSSDENSFRIVGMENVTAGYLTAGWLPNDTYIRNANGNVLIESFLSPFDGNGFSVSDLPFRVGPDNELAGQHLSSAAAREWFNNYGQEYDRDGNADFDDYDALDRITSGYMMGTFNFFDYITVVGGARVENTFLEYRGILGSAGDPVETGEEIQVSDTVRSKSYLEIFPQINVKIQPKDWFDIRLAATRTINRPNFRSLVPWERLDQFNKTLQRGNFDLEHTIATNYDVFLSFYNNTGLLTIGGFYKQLDNIDFERDSRFTRENGDVLQLTQPDNASGVATVKGVEIDLQMNFRFLPSPFNGLIASANATFIETTTFFPFQIFLQNPFREVIGERETSMIGQPENIYNLSLGYEKGGFTGRVSLLHQGRVIQDINTRSDIDNYDEEFTRVDLTFKQSISEKLRLYVNINNLTNQKDIRILRGDLTEFMSEFGTTADFGFQIKLN